MGRKITTNSYLSILILTDFFLVLISAFIFFDFRVNRLAEIDDLNVKLTSLHSMKDKMGTLSRIIRESKADRDNLDLHFITKETTSNFIEELESLAIRSGVILKIRSLNVGKEDKQVNKPSYLKFDLRFDGSFPRVFKFLKILENLPYRIRLNMVKVARLENEDGSVSKGTKGKVDWFGEVSLDLISYVTNN